MKEYISCAILVGRTGVLHYDIPTRIIYLTFPRLSLQKRRARARPTAASTSRCLRPSTTELTTSSWGPSRRSDCGRSDWSDSTGAESRVKTTRCRSRWPACRRRRASSADSSASNSSCRAPATTCWSCEDDWTS